MPDDIKVPFTDLARQYHSLKSEIDSALTESVLEFNFIRGSKVNTFEQTFARTLHVSSCIATANGTDSLFLILKALGIQNGDEVITPAFSWISSAEVISLCGATPVFADVDAKYYTIDPLDVEKRITPKTKAVIAVHLYGQMAPMKAMIALCKKHNLLLVEDCAQSHLSREGDRYAGSFGRAAAFSFYPTKNLGAYGDAGCVVTDDDVLAERVRRVANHGALKKDDHLTEGINSRMDSLQAAILLAKLPSLSTWNAQRLHHAQTYAAALKGIGEIILPEIRPDTTHTFHLFVIRTSQRKALQQELLGKGIQTLVHYPCALPNLPAYQYLNCTSRDFPVASMLQDEVLSLPVHPELSGEQIQYVCENIREFFRKRAF